MLPYGRMFALRTKVYMNEQESSAEDARGMVRRGDRRGSNYVQKAREKLKGVPHAIHALPVCPCCGQGDSWQFGYIHIDIVPIW